MKILESQQTSALAKRLMRWYKENARNLPWRKTRDPYKIWISEVMLQQTTVAAVVPYYKKWVKVFPHLRKVARAPLPRILKIWQGLGYYERARNIHKSARIIARIYKGIIPQDLETIKNLPGFGPYTTGAVLSIAYGQRHSVVDANVRRVVLRLLALLDSADHSRDKRISVFLDKIMPQKEAGIFNQAFMELGAVICRPNIPLCFSCPVKAFCLAYRKDLQDIIPAPLKRVIQKIEAAAAVIKKDDLYFIQKRPSKGLLADLWEFPGGKMNRGEAPKEALRRELKEELGVSLVSAKHLLHIKHSYTKFQVRLHVWCCQVKPLPCADKTHKWVRLKAFGKYPMPSATSKIVKTLIAH